MNPVKVTVIVIHWVHLLHRAGFYFEILTANQVYSENLDQRISNVAPSKGNHYYNNSFFDRNLSNESCNDFMLHETVANAIHAIKGLYSLYYKEVDWSEFKSEENWTKSTR